MNTIKFITNNAGTSVSEDYDGWVMYAQYVLEEYCALLKKLIPPSDYSGYAESLKDLYLVWILGYRFKNGSKAERLAMKNEISQLAERLYRYNRSRIVCTRTGFSAENV